MVGAAPIGVRRFSTLGVVLVEGANTARIDGSSQGSGAANEDQSEIERKVWSRRDSYAQNSVFPSAKKMFRTTKTLTKQASLLPDAIDGPHYISHPFKEELARGVSSINDDLKALLAQTKRI